MAKCRIGHRLEARVLEALGVDSLDESVVLSPADDEHHVDKHAFRAPFVCGARGLGEALRRIGEGAAMIRSKGEAGSGNIVEAVRHLRQMGRDLRELTVAPAEERMARAKALGAPYELVVRVAESGHLPVPNFAAGGIATPADAALCMALGAEAVFVARVFSPTTRPRRRASSRHAAGPASAGGVAQPRRRDAGSRSKHSRARRSPAAAGEGQRRCKAGSRPTRVLARQPPVLLRKPSISGPRGARAPGGSRRHAARHRPRRPPGPLAIFSNRFARAIPAGLILAAPPSRTHQRSFAVLDVDVERNAYGF
jgi:hypothetical protein